MFVGVLPAGEPGVFRSLLLPQTADALAAGEPVTALGLTQDDLAVGALAGYLEDGRFQISSLYVAPEYRRCGGGRMLLETLFEALDGLASGVEISFTVTREEHGALIPFLEIMGFLRQEDKGQTLYLTELGKAAETSFFAAAGKKAGVPFSELSDGGLSLAAKAAMWAHEKGMISGTSFDSAKACTRAMTMEYFWKQAGSPVTEVSGKFADVAADASYAQAVAWAVANGVTTGVTDTTFVPDKTCTRGQIVTFLYRALV